MGYPTGELSVDLRAIVENWQIIRNQLSRDVRCGAVVKANAYGLGVDRIAPKIYQAGCREFFVSNLKEAQQLKSLVASDANIYVLTGCNAGAEREFIKRGYIPVIVSFEMLERWAKAAESHEHARAVLKVNTGMGRMGIEPEEFETLMDHVDLLRKAKIEFLMSHFACADEQCHPLNQIQVDRFNRMKRKMHDLGVSVKATLANSAGIFWGDSAHGDVVRPGIALYGGNPGQGVNPMKPVVSLYLPIIQVRRLPAGECVGYGATKCFDQVRDIAVVAGGYADGIMRCLSNKGWGYLNGMKVPLVGRVSMDTTMFDVTEVVAARGSIDEGAAIEVLGEHVTVDELAAAASTISYEILTSLGSRYQRCYID